MVDGGSPSRDQRRRARRRPSGTPDPGPAPAPAPAGPTPRPRTARRRTRTDTAEPALTSGWHRRITSSHSVVQDPHPVQTTGDARPARCRGPVSPATGSRARPPRRRRAARRRGTAPRPRGPRSRPCRQHDPLDRALVWADGSAGRRGVRRRSVAASRMACRAGPSTGASCASYASRSGSATRPATVHSAATRAVPRLERPALGGQQSGSGHRRTSTARRRRAAPRARAAHPPVGPVQPLHGLGRPAPARP